MKLASVAFRAPSRIVTNDEILAMIREHSGDIYDGKIDRMLHEVKVFLEKSGLVQRHWLNGSESPIGLLSAAIAEALEKAALAASDVDLVIYGGVDRGFVEPGDSYLIAHATGLRNAKCFDVIDACNSWMRAVYIASNLIRSGEVKNALVVNAEFSMRERGYINPHAFRVQKTSDLHFLFPSYTLGEGATATVLQKSADVREPMCFQFSSRPDLAELCVMPTEGFRGRCVPTEKMEECRPHRFSSFGADLFREAVPEMEKLVRAAKVEHDAVKAIFTHSATHKSWVKGFEGFGLADKMFSIYPEFGNIAAASIPAAIATAMQRGVVARGDALLACVASAGMSFSLCKFTL